MYRRGDLRGRVLEGSQMQKESFTSTDFVLTNIHAYEQSDVSKCKNEVRERIAIILVIRPATWPPLLLATGAAKVTNWDCTERSL